MEPYWHRVELDPPKEINYKEVNVISGKIPVPRKKTDNTGNQITKTERGKTKNHIMGTHKDEINQSKKDKRPRFKMMQHLKEIDTGEFYPDRWRILHKDGTLAWMLIKCILIKSLVLNIQVL